MTATIARRDQPGRFYDGQGDELGPIATFGAQFFVFAALVFGFQVTGYEILPGMTPVALLAGVFGILVLTPVLVLRRIPVSLLVLCMAGLMAASVMWTDNPAGTAFALQRDLPLVFGMAIIAGIIPMRDLVPPLLWVVRFSVAFTLIIVAIFPETRLHIDVDDPTLIVDGWHGYFPHKNIMTPFLVLCTLTTLTFDRSQVLKWLTIIGIGVLLVGSDSVTGLSSAMLAVSIWVWIQLYKNLDLRNSSVFVVSSLSVGLFSLLGAIASLATLTSASGKDLTFTGRTYIWAATVDAISERPILGWGMSGVLFGEDVTPKTAEMWRAIGFQVPHAHSGALDLTVQLGFVGLVLFSILFFSTMIDGVSMVRAKPKVAAWIVSTIVVQLYMSLSENVFLGSGWLLMLVMFRILLLRQHGMELETGTQLAERLRFSAASRSRIPVAPIRS